MTSTPKYRNPPVVETVLGVQFQELDAFRAAHFGLYWKLISEEFTKIEDKPRLPPVVESFPRNAVVPQIQFAARSIPDRVWYVSDSDDEVIQVQPDRFFFNWRRRKEPYPTFEKNKSRFLNKFEAFSLFCEQEKLGPPKVNLCEVAYINHIIPIEDETATELAGTLFNGLRWETTEDGFPRPESAVFNRVFVIEHEGDKRGRLYAESSVARTRDETQEREIVLLQLTARVNHRAAESTTIADSLQLAHDWVVNGFANLTDLEMQKQRWERTK
ncbi:MAG: TIGR04255 family protein [Planctomycetes bacterium]|nr:TIGR04255 family protein [Planctomycetota bacterium]